MRLRTRAGRHPELARVVAGRCIVRCALRSGCIARYTAAARSRARPASTHATCRVDARTTLFTRYDGQRLSQASSRDDQPCLGSRRTCGHPHERRSARMKVVLFYQSILSCWNHGNVHFLRGVARELIQSGHQVAVYEPEDGWSRTNALADHGGEVFAETAALIPGVAIHTYRNATLDLEQATDGADLVIVHEWNSP